jgi:hypothetical protein
MAITHHLSMLSKTALRTAVDNDGILDKEATSYNDIFDAFRLALKFYHFE